MDRLLTTGSIVLLGVSGKEHRKELLVERLGAKFMFAEVASPYHRLRVCDEGNGRYSTKFMMGTPCRENTFKLIEARNGLACFVLELSRRGAATGLEKGRVELAEYALTLGTTGTNFSIIEYDHSHNVNCEFIVTAVDTNLHSSLSRPIFIPEHHFTAWELQRFVLEGYIQITGLVNRHDVDCSIAFLNHELGKPGRIVPGGVQNQLGKFTGDLSNCNELRRLIGGKLAAAVDALVGRGNYDKCNLSAQIAFRFPEPQLGPIIPETPHGIVWHTDGLRQGQSHGFSLLVGICLSDVTDDYQGNLTVWPGSHLLLHQCKISPHGALDIVTFNNLTREKQYFSRFHDPNAAKLLVEISPHKGFHDNEPALPTLGTPFQLRMKAGDVVFLHPDLAHAGAPNTNSSEIRRMLYFRIKINASNAGGFQNWEEVEVRHEKDMWCDLPGVRAQLGDSIVDGLMQIFQN